MILTGYEDQPELISKVCAHLTKELSEEYSPQMTRKGSRLKPSAILQVSWEGDEISVSLEDRDRVHKVRMVLPLFEENGYTLTLCGCVEERYLDEQRCHHMWAAQNHVLLSLEKQQQKIQDTRPGWQKLTGHLKGFTEELEKESGRKAPVVRAGDSLFWVLRSDLSLAPALGKVRDGVFRVLGRESFLAARSHWMASESGRLVALMLLEQSIKSGPRGFEDLSSGLFPLLAGCPEVYSEHDRVKVTVIPGSLGIRVEKKFGGYTLRPFLEGSEANHLCLIGEDLIAGITDRACGRELRFATPGPSGVGLFSYFEQNSGGFLPEDMRREFAAVLARLQLCGKLLVSVPLLPVEEVSVPKSYFRLTPLEPQGMVLELFLRPLQGAAFADLVVRPGEGADSLADFSLLPPRVISRDTGLELSRSQKLLETLLPEAEPQGEFVWKIPSDEEALEFLERVSASSESGEIFLEWPEGISRTPARFQVLEQEKPEISVTAEKSRDWFDLKGGFWLDGCHVSLMELLRAWQRSQRYIRLSHGKWFRISDSLKQRLAAFSGNLCLDQKGQLRPSPGFFLRKTEGDPWLTVTGDPEFVNFQERLARAENQEIPPPLGLQADLRSYQKEGFLWAARLSAWSEGCILADDMGLGKTIQAIALLLHCQKGGPSLVLCPTSLCDNWEQEMRRFAPDLKPVHYREERRLEADWFEQKKPVVVIVSYGLLRKDADIFSEHSWNLLIPDEAQNLKNASGMTSKSVRRLRKNFALVLSGTPVENNPMDLWSLFQLVWPGLLGDAAGYKKLIADPIRLRQCPQAQKTLRSLAGPFILRRQKEDYLKELPPKILKMVGVYLSGEERHLYDSMRMDAIASLKAEEVSASGDSEGAQKQGVKILAWLTRLRQVVLHPRLIQPDWSQESAKEKEFYRLADSLVQGGHKTLVFSQFPAFLEILAAGIFRRGYSSTLLRGSVSSADRQEMVRLFQKGGTDFFLISLKAGGTGLNLTRAGCVVLLDPWWNPAAEAQAMDRAFRMGQKQTVTVIRLIARKTIEEKVVAMQEEKQGMTDRCLEGSENPFNYSEEFALGLLDL